MECPKPLIPGTLIRRYKRFLADIRLEDGTEVTAHCPNSGSLATCLGDGWPVLVRHDPNPRRKLSYTWELVHNGRCWIGINTHRANALAQEAIENGHIPELAGPGPVLTEVRYGRSRVDLVLGPPERLTYVEVKNVTMIDDQGAYAFPDAPTARGRKHLAELMTVRRLGHHAAMLFVIQRTDGTLFRPADEVDPAYGELLRAADAAGVEILAYTVRSEPPECSVAGRVPVRLESRHP